MIRPPSPVTAAVVLGLIAAALLCLAAFGPQQHPASVRPAPAAPAAGMPGQAMDNDPAPAADVVNPEEAFLLDLNAAGIYGATADETVTLGQQVCEGVTSQVPTGVMQATILRLHPDWSPAAAAVFIATAERRLCVPSGS